METSSSAGLFVTKKANSLASFSYKCNGDYNSTPQEYYDNEQYGESDGQYHQQRHPGLLLRENGLRVSLQVRRLDEGDWIIPVVYVILVAQVYTWK